MTAQGNFKLVDIDRAVPSFDERQELKEAVCDALINMVHARAGGRGPAGETVYSVHPQDWFVSDFLLHRFAADGKDQSTDIRVAVHGAEFKAKQGQSGTLKVRPRFSAYVRVVPTWDDLASDCLDLRPPPRLKANVRKDIFSDARKRVKQALEKGDKRNRKELLSLFSQELMTERGIKFAGGRRNVIATAPDGELGEAPDEDTAQAQDGSRITLVQTLLDGDDVPDGLCVQEQVPLKWRRLAIELPELVLDLLADDGARHAASVDYSRRLKDAVKDAYVQFLATDEGRDWAWRPAQFSPNTFRSRDRWEQALRSLRASPPMLGELWPEQEPSLSLEWTPDPLDPSIASVRIALEHLTGKDHRRTADPGLYQVSVEIEIPAPALIPFTLERVKPSYAISGYMSVDAAGVNCGVNSDRGEDGVKLTTTWAPRYTLPRIVPNEIRGFDVAYVSLADAARPVASLSRLADEFNHWIGETERNVDPAAGIDPADAAAIAKELDHFHKDIEDWKREVSSLQAGLSLLRESETAFRSDPSSRRGMPYRAWILMNRTFLESARKRGWDERTAGWRLFQLGFVLSGVTGIATRMEEFHDHYDAERDERVSLLYFATGGGKSEAFFGLLIFTLFLDRLRGKSRGVSALMRYPLRLLTAQQARRLARLLSEAEVIKANERIAGAPFEIGFWVGKGSTPNNTLDNGKIIDELKDVPQIGPSAATDERKAKEANGYREALKNFNKLHDCPFCGEPTALRIYPDQKDRLGIVCLDEECRWNRLSRRSGQLLKPLPFLLVDSDIYRRAPAILLGTVDKLALLGQHVSTVNRLASMFGLARWIEDGTGILVSPDTEKELKGPIPRGWSTIAPAYQGGKEIFVDPVPALIVQDEAHLLEESLGTFAGLFETTLYQWFRSLRPLLGNRMATVPGAPTLVRLPKVIAATATISDPVKQVEALYQRRVERFPQPGPELHRSFYAAPRRFDGAARERESWARQSHEREWLAPWARVYVSLITNGAPHTSTTVTILAAFMAIITRLSRDLCSPDLDRRRSAAALLVQNLGDGLLRRRHTEVIRALDAADRHDVIASVVDLHRVALTYVTNKKGGDQILSATDGVCEREHRMLGAAYAIRDNPTTRLISGGVESGEIESIVKDAEKPHDPTAQDVSETLRMIVATSAISHGVDVERFNSMFFAGMPTDIAEYIQASSRVGRTHVGFVMLIPTPQARRDRYIAEVHETFHRFLERMIAPPAIERWAWRAVKRVLPSIIQNWLAGVVTQDEFRRTATADKMKVRRYIERREICSLKQKLGNSEFKRILKDYILASIGADEPVGGAGADKSTYDELVASQIERFVQNLDEPNAAGNMQKFWSYYRDELDEPMTSLRDVDAPGKIVPHASGGGEASDARLREALHFVRDGRFV